MKRIIFIILFLGAGAAFVADALRVSAPIFITIDTQIDARAYWPAGTTAPGTAASDLQAVSRAISNATAGSTIYLKRGRWDLSTMEVVDVSKKLHFVGDGKNQTTIVGAPTDATNGFNITVTGVSFEGIRFSNWYRPLKITAASDGNIKGFDLTYCEFDSCTDRLLISGATTARVDGIHITNCTVQNSETGFVWLGEYSNANVHHNYFRNLVNTTDAGVEAIVFGNSTWTVTGAETGNSDFSHNQIDTLIGPAADGYETHGILLYGYNNIIDGNNIRYVYKAGTGALLGQDAEAIYWKGYNTVVSNNVIWEGDGDNSDGAIADKAGADGGRNTIIGNIVYKIKSIGITVTTPNTVVSDNQVYGDAVGAYTTGIQVYQADGVACNNNKVDVYGVALRGEDATNLDVNGETYRSRLITGLTAAAYITRDAISGRSGINFHHTKIICDSALTALYIKDNTAESYDYINVSNNRIGGPVVLQNAISGHFNENTVGWDSTLVMEATSVITPIDPLVLFKTIDDLDCNHNTVLLTGKVTTVYSSHTPQSIVFKDNTTRVLAGANVDVTYGLYVTGSASRIRMDGNLWIDDAEDAITNDVYFAGSAEVQNGICKIGEWTSADFDSIGTIVLDPNTNATDTLWQTH